MFKQTEEQYRYVRLGEGEGSLYSFGCYLVSLVNGLNLHGYSFTPEGFNDLLRANKAWVGPYKNYIDVDNLHRYFPDMFNSYQRIDPWNDVPSTADLLKKDLVVVCRVSAKPIGGSGDHFVLLIGEEKGVAVIHDPWTGTAEKITNRWGKLGNILGVRVFSVRSKAEQVSTPLPEVIVDGSQKIDLHSLDGNTPLDEVYGILTLNAIKSKILAKDTKIVELKNELSSVSSPVIPTPAPQEPEVPTTPPSDSESSNSSDISTTPSWLRWLLGLFARK